MNLIKNKLHSKRGASLMIALVYLIFAVFIGGSVLAAASANGYRIEHLSDQQDYLNQRSAALLLAEEMDIDAFSNISLDAKYVSTLYEPYILHDSGTAVADPDRPVREEISLVFDVNINGKVDALTRVMFETAILRYLEEKDLREFNGAITIMDFVYDNGTASGQAVTQISDFWTVNDGSCTGEIQISGIKEGEVFTEYTARYTCGEGNHLYDFIVDFGDYSQLTVTMNGFHGVSSQPSVAEFQGGGREGEYQYTDRVTVETERTAISWNRPAVAKGGK